jgi:hypothetical protein
MARSRSRSKSPRKTQKHHYYVTFHGLMKWHDHLFKHLGWMILAQEHGYTDKIKVYQQSIKRFKKALEQKIKETEEKDRINDLKILHKNAIVLMKHANKDFK